MKKIHRYTARTVWTGNRGQGTSAYRNYDRDHQIAITGKPLLACSSDGAFRGDASRHTPEDLLVSSLSGCHMLWYLHLCAVNGVVVTEYTDDASGEMEENTDGSGQFTRVTLRPKVTVSEPEMIEKARALHTEAHKMCFIARSVSFPVDHLPEVIAAHTEGAKN